MYSFDETKLEKSKIVKWLEGEYKSLQTGRATPSVLDGIQIDQYGTRTALTHCSSVSVEDARTLRVSPFDKGLVRDIEKAINEGDLGLSVSTDDLGLRVSFPMLTTETRERMMKVVKDKLEDARVKIRGLREEKNKDIDRKKEEGQYGEDQRMKFRNDLQKIIDEANSELGDVFDKKEKEVMG